MLVVWLIFYVHCSVAWWRNGYGVGLAFERSQVRFPAVPPSLHQVATLGKLFTHMCLCHSSIIWYRAKSRVGNGSM